jgi:ArsR family metal-binding transcriptional regulator
LAIISGEIGVLKSYKLEIFNNECMPGAMTVQCFAHLDQDVSKALPYLNAVLGGFQYTKEPPSVSFKAHGKLIAVSGRRIAVNALKDQAEAQKIVAWIQREINTAWENRATIEPRYEGMPAIQVIEILKLLPMTNCRQCGASTCMVFATQVAEGVKTTDDCPPIDEMKRKKLNAYLAPFNFEL